METVAQNLINTYGKAQAEAIVKSNYKTGNRKYWMTVARLIRKTK